MFHTFPTYYDTDSIHKFATEENLVVSSEIVGTAAKEIIR